MAKILIIDDEPDLAKLLLLNLKLSGYEVELASAGEEGINRAVGLKPDLIILDIDMPVFDGWQVLEILRSNAATGKIPVVMSSAKDGVADAEKSFKLGASGYVPKPINLTRMLRKIEELLKPVRSGGTSAE